MVRYGMVGHPWVSIRQKENKRRMKHIGDKRFHVNVSGSQKNINWILLLNHVIRVKNHCVKSVQVKRFSGPYFPVFGLNTKIYPVNLGIQSKYGKIRTRKSSVFGHFYHIEYFRIRHYLLKVNNGNTKIKTPIASFWCLHC